MNTLRSPQPHQKVQPKSDHRKLLDGSKLWDSLKNNWPGLFKKMPMS